MSNSNLLVLGCGPSLTESHVEQYLPYNDSMSINRPIYRTDKWLIIDHGPFQAYKEELKEFRGDIWTTDQTSVPEGINVKRFQAQAGLGVSLSLSTPIYCRYTSIYAAIQLGFAWGYDSIYLFGVDMAEVNGHLYPPGEKLLVDWTTERRISRFEKESQQMEWLVTHCPEQLRLGIHVVSSYNPWPWVNMVNHHRHEEIIMELIGE